MRLVGSRLGGGGGFGNLGFLGGLFCRTITGKLYIVTLGILAARPADCRGSFKKESQDKPKNQKKKKPTEKDSPVTKKKDKKAITGPNSRFKVRKPYSGLRCTQNKKNKKGI